MDAGRLEGLASGIAALRGEVTTPTLKGEGFGQLVGRVAADASQTQVDAEAQVRALAEGRGDLVNTVLAMNRAELSLDFIVQVRDRALEAYQEVMRLQI